MKIRAIKLLNFGSLTTDEEEKELDKNSLTNFFLRPTKIKFVSKTDKLVGVKGLKFGIEYFVEGHNKKEKYGDATFYCKLKHPQLTNPKTKKRKRVTLDKKINYVNQNNFDYFSFDENWEVVKGTWTFQIIEKGTLLFEKSFDIV